MRPDELLAPRGRAAEVGDGRVPDGLQGHSGVLVLGGLFRLGGPAAAQVASPPTWSETNKKIAKRWWGRGLEGGCGVISAKPELDTRNVVVSRERVVGGEVCVMRVRGLCFSCCRGSRSGSGDSMPSNSHVVQRTDIVGSPRKLKPRSPSSRQQAPPRPLRSRVLLGQTRDRFERAEKQRLGACFLLPTFASVGL